MGKILLHHRYTTILLHYQFSGDLHHNSLVFIYTTVQEALRNISSLQNDQIRNRLLYLVTPPSQRQKAADGGALQAAYVTGKQLVGD